MSNSKQAMGTLMSESFIIYYFPRQMLKMILCTRIDFEIRGRLISARRIQIGHSYDITRNSPKKEKYDRS